MVIRFDQRNVHADLTPSVMSTSGSRSVTPRLRFDTRRTICGAVYEFATARLTGEKSNLGKNRKITFEM